MSNDIVIAIGSMAATFLLGGAGSLAVGVPLINAMKYGEFRYNVSRAAEVRHAEGPNIIFITNEELLSIDKDGKKEGLDTLLKNLYGDNADQKALEEDGVFKINDLGVCLDAKKIYFRQVNVLLKKAGKDSKNTAKILGKFFTPCISSDSGSAVYKFKQKIKDPDTKKVVEVPIRGKEGEPVGKQPVQPASISNVKPNLQVNPAIEQQPEQVSNVKPNLQVSSTTAQVSIAPVENDKTK